MTICGIIRKGTEIEVIQKTCRDDEQHANMMQIIIQPKRPAAGPLWCQLWQQLHKSAPIKRIQCLIYLENQMHTYNNILIQDNLINCFYSFLPVVPIKWNFYQSMHSLLTSMSLMTFSLCLFRQFSNPCT